MVRNLIRNGGFERGDTSFWTGGDHGGFVVSEVQKYKGRYSGKLSGGVATAPYIMNNDFIRIAPGEAFILRGYAYPSEYYVLTPQILYYDEGLSLIETQDLIARTIGTAQWTGFGAVVSYTRDAEYFKLKLKQVHVGEAQYTYWDNLSLYKIEVKEVIGEITEIFPLLYMEGEITEYGEYFPVIGYKEAVFTLNVTAKTSETGTLDVTVQTYDKYNDLWHDIASFSQVTTVLGSQVLVVTAGIGEIIRCKLDQGGTEPGFTAGVSGIFKR